MNISKINSNNANIKSQQESDSISRNNKNSNNADVRSHQRSDNKVCIETLDGRKVINSTNVHIIHYINRAQSHNMSDNTTGITYHIASEFNINIDIVIDNMQESFTKQAYVKSKNILGGECTRHLRPHLAHQELLEIYYIKSIVNIDLIEQKYYNKSWIIEADNIKQKYYIKNGHDHFGIMAQKYFKQKWAHQDEHRQPRGQH